MLIRKKSLSKKLSTLGFIAITSLLITGAAYAADPVIDVWYGTDQQFGQMGTPQQYINIPGNVYDPDSGGSIDSLVYTLNDTDPPSKTPRVLSMGPDTRLINLGDFNLDIDIADTDLVIGDNTIVITATDNDLNESQVTVTLNYASGNVWPLPYTADWSSITDI